jgi:hypothetical protein
MINKNDNEGYSHEDLVLFLTTKRKYYFLVITECLHRLYDVIMCLREKDEKPLLVVIDILHQIWGLSAKTHFKKDAFTFDNFLKHLILLSSVLESYPRTKARLRE